MAEILWGILSVLRKTWKVWLPVAIVIAIGVYVETLRLEVTHYKDKVNVVQKSFEDYKATQESIHETLVEESKGITEAHQDTLNRETGLIYSNRELVRQGIMKDEELNRIKLSNNAVRLFNNGASAGNSNTGQSTDTKPGNVEEANPTEATASNVSLQTLLDVSNENMANHRVCVKQVEEWQSFWSDYVRAVENAKH